MNGEDQLEPGALGSASPEQALLQATLDLDAVGTSTPARNQQEEALDAFRSLAIEWQPDVRAYRAAQARRRAAADELLQLQNDPAAAQAALSNWDRAAPYFASASAMVDPSYAMNPIGGVAAALQAHSKTYQDALEASRKRLLERAATEHKFAGAEEEAQRAEFTQATGAARALAQMERAEKTARTAGRRMVTDPEFGVLRLDPNAPPGQQAEVVLARGLLPKLKLEAQRMIDRKLDAEQKLMAFPPSPKDLQAWRERREIEEKTKANRKLSGLFPDVEGRAPAAAPSAAPAAPARVVPAVAAPAAAPIAAPVAAPAVAAPAAAPPETRPAQREPRILQPGEAKYADVVGGKTGERDITQHDAAAAAVENIAKLNDVTRHLEGSKALTGMGADLLLQANRAVTLLTKRKEAGETVTDTELLDTMLGSDVFPMIKALGVGARGLDTPAEREFLRSVMTGTVSMNKETLKRMAEIRRNVAERAVQRWNERVEAGELDRYFEVTGQTKGPIPIPKRGDAAAGPATVTTKAERDALPAGSEYIYQGRKYRKK